MGFIQAPVKPNTPFDLSGKTVIVTGGNAGLGFECARQILIGKASKVTLACRTPSKGEAAREKLLADPAVKQNNPKADVKIMKLDMETYASVIDFADQVKREITALHVLLLNAGTGQLGYEKSPTGHEKVTQVNYLSNALLALELLPLLEATATREGVPTRMTWVGSRTHDKNADLAKSLLSTESVLERLDDQKRYSPMAHYSNTKLLCIMFITELAKRVSKDKVTINTMCPGMVKTNMTDVLPIYVRAPMNVILAMRARTPEQGGWIITNAVAVVGKESHGRFLLDKDIAA